MLDYRLLALGPSYHSLIVKGHSTTIPYVEWKKSLVIIDQARTLSGLVCLHNSFRNQYDWQMLPVVTRPVCAEEKKRAVA